MDVRLLSSSVEPDRTAAAAAQGCYSERAAHQILGDLSEEGAAQILRMVMGSGHHSVVEHAVFSFSVEGVSRSLTHQLVRHRIASYSQQSQRYVKIVEPQVVLPASMEKDPGRKERFQALMTDIWSLYRELVEAGVPVEDARYILPNATATNITITMNARSLLNFFAIRCCTRAQWEIRDLACRMLELVKTKAPVIFRKAGPSCVVLGYCPEGEKSCGRYPTLEDIGKKNPDPKDRHPKKTEQKN